MSYPDYRAAEIRRQEADASLFASVGLPWLARQSERKAARLRSESGSAAQERNTRQYA